MIAHRRTFTDYEHYIHKQGGKARTRADFLLKHLPKNTQSFTKVFRRAAMHLAPGPVLCLGARSGAESLGAVAAGFPGSVGIDLHPVGPTVLRGDWHELDFPSASFANVYTNSLDHCLYLDRLASEVRRILQKQGRFYVMATNRSGGNLDEWLTTCGSEALFWDNSDELCVAICVQGFTMTQSWRSGKWGHYVFGVL